MPAEPSSVPLGCPCIPWRMAAQTGERLYRSEGEPAELGESALYRLLDAGVLEYCDRHPGSVVVTSTGMAMVGSALGG